MSEQTTNASFEEQMYTELKAFIERRPASARISQSGFQRRQRIGFVMVGRVFDRAEADGLIVRAKLRPSEWVKPTEDTTP